MLVVESLSSVDHRCGRRWAQAFLDCGYRWSPCAGLLLTAHHFCPVLRSAKCSFIDNQLWDVLSLCCYLAVAVVVESVRAIT